MRQAASTMFRYIVVAVLAYVVDIGVFSLLHHSGVAGVTVSNVIGKIATAIFGFFAHRRVTFQKTGRDGMAKEAVKYFTVVILYTPFTTGLLLLLIPVSPNVTIAKIIADCVGVVASFAISKLFIFQKGPSGLDLP